MLDKLAVAVPIAEFGVSEFLRLLVFAIGVHDAKTALGSFCCFCCRCCR
jgi:hypothetical protein